MSNTYLTTEELSKRIHYDARTIRNQLKDSVLLEGTHYFRPFGGRKILFIWEIIERDMRQLQPRSNGIDIPMSAVVVCHVLNTRSIRNWVVFI